MREDTAPNAFQRMMERRNEGGFTLIELLIVIIILAVLAAIVVFAVGTTSKNAVAASCNADAKSVETAMEAYKAQTGGYPTAVSLLTAQTVTTVNGVNITVGPWLKAAPGTSHYSISIDTTGGVFMLPPGGGTPASANNFDVTPGICNSFT
jgi:prepilin-type N-terminal cleavage/methylation domain-containing protein